MRRLFVALIPLCLSGCYVINLAGGQLNLLANARRIDEMLTDPGTPAETKIKLRLIQEIKSFGEHEMGLSPSTNYTNFFDTSGRPVSYLVSACRKDRFEPHTWWFPIVGTVPYKGFFSKEDAEAEAQALEQQGYDTSVREVAAYSTLGWFSDPVLSTMLDYPEEELAALLLHELTHGTVYLPGGTDFNESLACFVGQQGALEFIRRRHGTHSETYDRAIQSFAREERRDAAARDLFERLDDFYRSALSSERKIELRDMVARFPVNNAEILMQRRYGHYEEFALLFEEAGGDWRRFFATIRSPQKSEPPEKPQAKGREGANAESAPDSE